MLALMLTAELQGVTNLRPDDTEQNPFWYTFSVQCTHCREIHPKNVAFNRFVWNFDPARRKTPYRMPTNTGLKETHEMSGSRGEANFIWTCKGCKGKQATATVKMGPMAYEQSDPPKKQKILEIDCRGLEFVSFKPEGEWLAEGVDTGTKFTDIELVEGEWFDYDERSSEEVGITNLVWEVVRS